MTNNKASTYVVIMAGGVGSRFWPASRTASPKQFHDMLGVGKSLIRLTFERFLHLCPAEHIFIVTNRQYKDLVMEHLPELSENQILCEPSRNNTAPCIAYSAFKLHELDPEANMIVAPSDHIITNEIAFLETLELALDFTAREDALVTLGIQPFRPDTGYGYIQFESEAVADRVYPVAQFTEKPNLENAQAFLASGDYLWNAGIFVWRAASILRAFEQHATEIFQLLGSDREVYNTPAEQPFIDRKYPQTPNISVDFAIMEKASNVYVIPSQFGWSDLGTWASLHAELEKDKAGNVVQGERVLLQGVSNSLIRVPGDKIVVIKDLEDFIVVDEGDILVVFPKSKEQEIKQITEEVRNRFGSEFI
ncbi:MAG: mannose-1-phosphate guanylyltransferase [Saprospirales bacterium]|nr:mannose-1-phosphate guanylyltransferase [Saprospirales bacterium]MBK8490017.1 mannose-1-phosphate guanylyltransferase [Saprospirales bacterium]